MKIVKLMNYNIAIDFLKHNFSSPTHWPDWNIVVSRYFQTNFFYFAAYKGKELLGICPVHEVNDGWNSLLYSGQFHYIPYGGWIFNNCENFDFRFLSLEYRQMFSGFSLPLIPDFKASYSGKKIIKYYTLLIDLQKDEKEIWENELNYRRRRGIRKAERNMIQIVEASSGDFFEMFYSLYQKAQERNKLLVLPKDFFIELLRSSTNIHYDLLLALKAEEAISALAVAYDKNFAFFWLGMSVEHAPQFGQGELLQWEAIKKAKALGCRYYDLCYIERERLPNIYEFKKGFSRNEVEISYFNIRPFVYRIFNRLHRWL